MTPGIKAAERAGIQFRIHEYSHDVDNQSYGLEAAEKLGLSAEQVFKTLVAQLDNKELVVAIVPVAGLLNLKALAKVAGAKKAAMADKTLVIRSTGYVLGGVSPLGQKKHLRTFIDNSVANLDTCFVSAGRRGLEIELSANDLQKVTQGRMVAIAQG